MNETIHHNDDAAEVQKVTEAEVSLSSQTSSALDKAASMEPNGYLSHAGAHVLFSPEIMTTVFAMLGPKTAIGAQRVCKIWKVLVDNHRDVGFMSPSPHRMMLELPDAEAVHGAKYELHPVVEVDPISKKKKERWVAAIRARTLMTGLYTSRPVTLIDFYLMPSFFLDDFFPRVPIRFRVPKPSWTKLQIARPWIQHLKLWTIDVGVSLHELGTRVRAVCVTNAKGITFGEVYDAMVEGWYSCYHGMSEYKDDVRAKFLWEILPLPMGEGKVKS